MTATPDEATGDYVLAMTGSAKMDWTSSGSTRWYELDRARVGWKPDVQRDGTLLADAPFAFDYPDWWANHETVRLPRGGKDFALHASDVDETVGGLYAFHRRVTLSGDTVTMDNDTRALKAELPAADAAKVRDRMAELGNHGQFIRLPATYEATDADMAALAADKPALAHAWLMRGAAAFDRGDMPGAIAGLNATLAIDAKQALAQGLLAFAYASQSDARAMAAAEAALAQDDKNDWAWAAKGLLALKAQKMADAIAAYDQLLIEAEGYFDDALTRRDTLTDYVDKATTWYAEAEAARGTPEELPLLRRIDIIYPEYRDVVERIEVLEALESLSTIESSDS